MLTLGLCAWSFYLFKIKYWDAAVVAASKELLVFIVVAASVHALAVLLQWTVTIISVRFRAWTPSGKLNESSTQQERRRCAVRFATRRVVWK